MTPELSDLIRRDFTAFADAATTVEFDGDNIRWRQDGEDRSVVLRPRAHAQLPDVIFNGRNFRYVEFFASDSMADLRDTAEKAARAWRHRPSYVADALFVDAPGAMSETPGKTGSIGDLVLQQIATAHNATSSPSFAPRTSVVFLHGSAGAGKTALLEHLATQRADAYLQGAATQLFLYFDAQEQSLAKLDDLIARSLQDVKARFTYHALPTLTRLGLVVPIVDGFDELLGYGGYREAFSSLSLFLARLDGYGSIITSARSTFYEYSELQHVESGTHAYEVTTIEVRPWDDGPIGDYLERTGAIHVLGTDTKAEAVVALRNVVGAQLSPLVGTPFFVSRLIAILKDGERLTISAHLREELVRELIRREVKKLVDKEPVLDEHQHLLLAQSIAEEMWHQERADLDTTTIKTIAELKCEQFGIIGRTAEVVIARAATHALLRPSAGRRIAFQHEYYYAYFLGAFIADEISRSERSAEDVLGRGALSEVVGASVAHSLLLTQSALQALEFLNRVRLPAISAEIGRANVGQVVGGVIRQAGERITGARIRSAVFVRPDFSGTRIDHVEFDNCQFYDPVFAGAAWHNVLLKNSQLDRIHIDNSTSFSGTALIPSESVMGVADVGDIGFAYEPVAVEALLARCGATLPDEVRPAPPELSARAIQVRETFRKFAGMVRKAYRFSEDDIQNRRIGMGEWEVLQGLLSKHGLITKRSASRRGTSGELMQLAVPIGELERGEAQAVGTKSEVANFWRELYEL